MPTRRWLYLDESQPEEARYRAEMLGAIDRWWSAFVAHQDDILRTFQDEGSLDLAAFMAEHLQAIDPRLCWEYGPAGDLGTSLTVTPESDHELRPLVHTILERAPHLAGWDFRAYRPADPPMLDAIVRGRVGGGVRGWTASAREGEDHRLDVTFFAPDAGADDAWDRACVATECLLGEEMLDKWVGVIEVKPARLWRRGAKPEELRAACERLQGLVHGRLPQAPCCRIMEERGWTLFELKPQEAADYPEQRDLFVARSAFLDLWKAAHRSSFHDCRFSRFGETFCYVKLDGSQGLAEESFADKGEIEDALTEALEPSQLGTVIGGGTGLQYSYVDLALLDLPAGIEAVRRVLAGGHVPRRSWIQFFDVDLAAEWIGVYPDSPPPPVSEEAAH